MRTNLAERRSWCQGPKHASPPEGLAVRTRSSAAKSCPFPLVALGWGSLAALQGDLGPGLSHGSCCRPKLGPTGAPIPTTSKLGCRLVLGLLVGTWTPNHKLTTWPDPHLPHHCRPAVPDLFTITMTDPDPDLLTCVPALTSELPCWQGIAWQSGLSVENGCSPNAGLPCWPLWNYFPSPATLWLRKQLACFVTCL